MNALMLAALTWWGFAHPARLMAQADTVVARNDSVSVKLVNVDLPVAVQALARYLDRPVVIGAMPGAGQVTFETPHPIPRQDVLRLLRGLVESQNFDLVADTSSDTYRLRSRTVTAPNPSPAVARSSGSSDEPQLFVIRLRHARATDVAAAVNALYGQSSAIGEIGAPSPTLAQNLAQGESPRTPAGHAPSPPQPAVLSGHVTIVPDPRTNSLLIRATPSDFALLQSAVTELDIRPLQVLIEVLVAEVRKDRSLNFGVGATLPATPIRGQPNTTVNASTTGISLGDFALTVMGLGPNKIDATLQAAASRGDATIISRPILLAANNEQAEISVGSQRPFIEVSRVLPTDNTARDQVVQYKDVGTKLSIVPTISADGYVMLQVMQEVDAATAEQQFDAPVISTRSVQTRLLVNDGQTIVLGGLRDSQDETSQGGVPFLSSIPFIGGLFGNSSHDATQTELFVFLTPHVISTDAQADSLTSAMRARSVR